ncbi:translocase subunit seca [Rhynchospora pubera]|uniref:Translocase subunit seca n=1 Tax=Rhynchospora pubera TaxID=906938 RepID=A0AAV8ESG2_9POAL|nr:translocase subunit seca [Rhynchospora pubera]
MNHYAMKSPLAGCEEVRSPFAVSDRRNPVFCPKPRRIGPVPPIDPVRPLRWQACCQVDLCDLRAGPELLDLFLPKAEEQSPVASSPPFFCGSPPSRVANPVVHDIRFGEDRPLTPTPFTINNGPHPVAMYQSAVPVPMSPRKGCVRAATKFGFQPATVRIEGFDCLENRDRRRHGITAVA